MNWKLSRVLIFLGFVSIFNTSLFAEVFKNPVLDKYSGLYFDKQSNLYFINNKISFSIHPGKNENYLDRIKYSIDNKPYQDYSGKIKFDKDGFHIVRFKAVDPVLNWSPTQNFRIYVDLTPPNTSTDWKGRSHTNGQSLFISRFSQLKLSSQDNLSGVSKIFWQENGSNKLNVYKEGKMFKEGNHTIKVASVDNVGNAENWKSLSFTVDATPPKSTHSIRGNTFERKGKHFIDKGSYVSLKATDEISGVKRIEYKINNGPIQTFNHKILIDEQVSDIQYRSIDNVDNREPWKPLKIFLDSTPPRLKVKNVGSHKEIAGKIYARKGFKITANVKDRDSGAKSLFINNNFENKTFKEIVFDQPGEHSIHFGAEDQVGNTANSVSLTVVIDESAPQTRLNASNNFVQKDDMFISSLPNKIDFTADDSGVGISYTEISFNGKDFKRVQGAIDLATWKNRSKVVYFRSRDKLGNLERTQQMKIYVRNRGPKVDLFVEKDDMEKVSLSDLIKNKNKMRLPASKKGKTKE